MLARHQRPHLGVRIGPRPDFQRPHLRLQLAHQRITGGIPPPRRPTPPCSAHPPRRRPNPSAHPPHHRYRHPASPPGGSSRLPAPVHACRATGHPDRSLRRSRSNRSGFDRGNIGMCQDRLDRLARTLHHLEHTVRYPSSSARSAPASMKRMGPFRRLHDEAVAARQRHRDHPQRHHQGKVERRDARDHAQRLADGSTTHRYRCRRLGELALRPRRGQVGGAPLPPARAALRRRHPTAPFHARRGNDRRELLAVPLQQLLSP